MFCNNLIVPLLMVIFGIIMLKYPSKNINGIYGYRTSMSRKNKDTWNFAHCLCGKLWRKIGWIMLFISVVVQLPFINSGDDVIGIVSIILITIQCVILIGSVIVVEMALRQNFNTDGTRK